MSTIKKTGDTTMPATGMPDAPGLPKVTGMPEAPGMGKAPGIAQPELHMPEVQSGAPPAKTSAAPPADDGRGRAAVLALAEHPLFGERPEIAPSDRPSLGNHPAPTVLKEALLKEFESHSDPAVRAAVAALRK